MPVRNNINSGHEKIERARTLRDEAKGRGWGFPISHVSFGASAVCIVTIAAIFAFCSENVAFQIRRSSTRVFLLLIGKLFSLFLSQRLFFMILPCKV